MQHFVITHYDFYELKCTSVLYTASTVPVQTIVAGYH